MARKAPKRRAPVIEDRIEPTPEQIARGVEPVEFIHAESAQRVNAYINRGGTPIARWTRDGMLSDTQIAAIKHCQRLWEVMGAGPKVTSQYGERIPGSGNEDRRAATLCEARKGLWRIIDYFPGPLRTYYGCFENVCRFDMPAGIAGAELARTTRTAEARAHTVVCFVADIIATNERI